MSRAATSRPRSFPLSRQRPAFVRNLHHAQAPAVLDHSRTVPQGYGNARPALAGGAEGGERSLIVLDAGDVLDNARRQESKYRCGR